MQNLKSKVAMFVATVSPLAAFAANDDSVTQITSSITSSFASATTIVTTSGLALIAIAFLGFILRKGTRAASGKV